MLKSSRLVWRPNRKRGVPKSRRHGFAAHVREYVWPTMGLVAFGRWILLKLLRQGHRPNYVASGVALGVMVGFFPIPGTHTALLVLFCALFRTSFLAAFMGSMVANPWTVGPMWVTSFHLGRRILGMTPGSDRAIEHLNHISWVELWEKLQDKVEYVIFPTIVGGAVIGGPLAVAVYILVYWQLRRRRGKGLI